MYSCGLQVVGWSGFVFWNNIKFEIQALKHIMFSTRSIFKSGTSEWLYKSTMTLIDAFR